jgi:hypothetical protein
VFSVGADPRPYNEDPRPAELELKESLEMAVEDGQEEMAIRNLAVKIGRHMCCSTVIFGVCSYSETGIMSTVINPLPGYD